MGVICVSAVFFHLVNNYLKVNLQWPNSLKHTFRIGSYVRWSVEEVYPGPSTHQLAADCVAICCKDGHLHLKCYPKSR